MMAAGLKGDIGKGAPGAATGLLKRDRLGVQLARPLVPTFTHDSPVRCHQQAADTGIRVRRVYTTPRQLERARGRPLLLPLLLGGTGRGARLRLADGTDRIDFVGGIGQYLFGHSDHDLLETAAALTQDGGELDAGTVDEALQGKTLRYDKGGEEHLDACNVSKAWRR